MRGERGKCKFTTDCRAGRGRGGCGGGNLLTPRHNTPQRAEVRHYPACCCCATRKAMPREGSWTKNHGEELRRWESLEVVPNHNKNVLSGTTRWGRCRLTFSLTPRVESAWFQLLERTSLSSRWFQIDSTCTPTTRRPPYTEVFAAELKNAVGGGCRLDPGLKGKRPVSQKFQPNEDKICFQIEPCI